MKRILSLLIIALLLLCPVLSAYADDGVAVTKGGKPTVVDEADLLTESEEIALSKRLSEIGDKYQCDVVVVTVPGLGGADVEEYAEAYFNEHGYGYGAIPDADGKTVDGDGVMLLFSAEGGAGNRDYTIRTCGYAITAITDYGIQRYLEPMFLPYLSINDFNSGFLAFADGCGDLLKLAREGDPFDVFNATEQTANGKPVIADMAGLLTVEDVATLSQRLKNIGDKYQCDVIFVTDTDAYTDGSVYAKQYYQNNGYGYGDRGGILAYYSEASGELALYTAGFASKAFVGRGLYKFRQDLLSALYRGDFAGVVKTYAERSEFYLDKAQNGRVFNPINWLPIILALIAGALIALIPVNAMKRQLTDVSRQTNADRYLEPSTFVMTQNSDVLLGTNIARTVHVVQSSSGGSSGGGRTGGGGGFHGGSTTHTSSSGGTFGGHSGKI